MWYISRKWPKHAWTVHQQAPIQQDQRKPTLRTDNLLEADDVLMLEPLQQLDLSDGCDWKSLLLIFHSDFLKGQVWAGCVDGPPQEDFSICALADLLALGIAAQTQQLLVRATRIFLLQRSCSSLFVNRMWATRSKSATKYL